MLRGGGLRASVVALAPARRRGRTAAGETTTLFDVVMQSEEAAHRQRRHPSTATRASSSAAAAVSPRTKGGVAGKRPVLVMPAIAAAAPTPPVMPSAGSEPQPFENDVDTPSRVALHPQPSSTPSFADRLLRRAGCPPTSADDRHVIMAPLTPQPLRAKRRPKSTRQRAVDVQLRQATGSDEALAPVSRQYHATSVAAAEASSYSQRNVSGSEGRAIAGVVASAVAAFVLCAGVAWPMLRDTAHDRKSMQLQRELEMELSAATRHVPDSESEVDRRAVIGADPLLPQSMLSSFATPYWTPSADEVLSMFELRAAPFMAPAATPNT